MLLRVFYLYKSYSSENNDGYSMYVQYTIFSVRDKIGDTLTGWHIKGMNDIWDTDLKKRQIFIPNITFNLRPMIQIKQVVQNFQNPNNSSYSPWNPSISTACSWKVLFHVNFGLFETKTSWESKRSFILYVRRTNSIGIFFQIRIIT